MPRPSTGEARAAVRVAAGSRAGDLDPAYVVPHAWSDAGIAVESDGTGAHLLLVAVGSCLLNDVYREAGDVPVDGVLVEVSGDFDDRTWSTTAVGYAVHVDTSAGEERVRRLLARVDEVAEVPRVLRGEVSVEVRRA